MRRTTNEILDWLFSPSELMSGMTGLPYSRFSFIASFLGNLIIALLLCIGNSKTEIATSLCLALIALCLLCYAPMAYEAYTTPPEE